MMLNGISIYHGVCHPPHGSASRAAETRCTSQAAPVINGSSASPARCSLGTSWRVQRGESQLRCHPLPPAGVRTPASLLGGRRCPPPTPLPGVERAGGSHVGAPKLPAHGMLGERRLSLSQPCLSCVPSCPDPSQLRCPSARQSHKSRVMVPGE